MTKSPDQRHPSRRAVLRRLAQATALAGGGVAASRAFGQDAALQALIDQNQGSDFGQGFDSGSRTIQMPKASLPTLSPATVQHTEQAIAQFEGIVAKGGWPEVAQADRLRLGGRNPAVPGAAPAPDGIRRSRRPCRRVRHLRFLCRGGRPPLPGPARPYRSMASVREQTLKALNVPAAVRLAQLRTNLVRLRSLSGNLGSRFVVCNIPAARIEAIEGGVAVSRHTAVAGKPDRPSPDINSKIVEINFNPYWTVPVSIVRRDLIPKMQAEPDYLTSNHIRIFDMRGDELTPSQINWYSTEAVNYRFKQDPGDFNSLGSMRINFPSKDGVYMHDTPAKGSVRRGHALPLVGLRARAERPRAGELAVDGNAGLVAPGDRRGDQERRAQGRQGGASPVPLYWVYVTAWATPDGVTQFREDIYNRDGLGPVAATKRG